jgi:hypothetical protein
MSLLVSSSSLTHQGNTVRDIMDKRREKESKILQEVERVRSGQAVSTQA